MSTVASLYSIGFLPYVAVARIRVFVTMCAVIDGIVKYFLGIRVDVHCLLFLCLINAFFVLIFCRLLVAVFRRYNKEPEHRLYFFGALFVEHVCPDRCCLVV